jgi:hypothetical protein
LTTLKKEGGTYATYMRSTIMHVLEHFVPDDREESDDTGKVGRKFKIHQIWLTIKLL